MRQLCSTMLLKITYRVKWVGPCLLHGGRTNTLWPRSHCFESRQELGFFLLSFYFLYKWRDFNQVPRSVPSLLVMWQAIFLFFYIFFQTAHLYLLQQMALLGFYFLPPHTAVLSWFKPTSLSSVELHRDPGPFEGRSTNWATAPRCDKP